MVVTFSEWLSFFSMDPPLDSRAFPTNTPTHNTSNGSGKNYEKLCDPRLFENP